MIFKCKLIIRNNRQCVLIISFGQYASLWRAHVVEMGGMYLLEDSYTKWLDCHCKNCFLHYICCSHHNVLVQPRWSKNWQLSPAPLLAVCQRDRLHYRLSELHRLNNYTVFFTGLHIDCTITMFSFHDCTYRLNNYTVFIKVVHILYYIYNVFITGLHRL